MPVTMSDISTSALRKQRDGTKTKLETIRVAYGSIGPCPSTTHARADDPFQSFFPEQPLYPAQRPNDPCILTPPAYLPARKTSK